MHQNVKRAKKVISELVPLMDNVEPCCCAEAAKQAVVTESVNFEVVIAGRHTLYE